MIIELVTVNGIYGHNRGRCVKVTMTDDYDFEVTSFHPVLAMYKKILYRLAN